MVSHPSLKIRELSFLMTKAPCCQRHDLQSLKKLRKSFSPLGNSQ